MKLAARRNLKRYIWAELSFSLVMVVIGTFLPLIMVRRSGLNPLVYILELTAAGGLGLQFLIYLTKASRRPLIYFLGLAVLVSAGSIAGLLIAV